MNGRTLVTPQGKLLGGSSAINAMAIVPSSKACQDAWAKLGNKGWDWESMAPYFRKFYTLNLPDEAAAQRLGLESTS